MPAPPKLIDTAQVARRRGVAGQGRRPHSLDALSLALLGRTNISLSQLLGSGTTRRTFDCVGLEQAVEYAAEDADVALQLRDVMKPQLERLGLIDLFRDVEMPLLEALAEMEWNQRKALCCGAGGGRMWTEEHEGKRVNIHRADMAIATGADALVVNCPFCMTMLTDGLKQRESNMQPMDLAELVASALPESTTVSAAAADAAE
jgi:hypothetical protein